MTDLITSVSQQFDPQQALLPHDPRYVDCSVERGSAGLLTVMANNIRFSSGSTHQLLSGQRGCGKTTELFLLGQALMNAEPGLVPLGQSMPYRSW